MKVKVFCDIKGVVMSSCEDSGVGNLDNDSRANSGRGERLGL